MEFFDFIKVIFTNPLEYSKCSNAEKRRHFFLFQRRMAINFPMQANALQMLNMNQTVVMDFWHTFLRKQYKYVPGWMYTKGVKKSKAIKESKAKISNDTVRQYCRDLSIDPKIIRDALEFYPNEMVKELKQYEKIIKNK